MICTHRHADCWVWQDVEVGLYGETEQQLVNVGGESAYEDLDTGRFRCTLCDEVGYYTGLWKRFFEEGVPCPGSDRIKR
ncbi:hypothetical protein [Caldimonas sp. KR1-144]|uniref:hypothetical protein n=1 Tax=Caldimonas sp. KR1-144 TaxID=3400911 RepID=UPI003C10BEBF